jgi:L-ascorbate metabolism protein UlaG (beta-lactamase superfamily)
VTTAPVIQVTWLGHSTVVLDVAGLRLVADPLLGRHNGLLRRRGQRPGSAAWTGADAVLLSHLHHDHAELRSLRMLGGTPVLTGHANAAWLRRRGLVGVGLGDEWHELGGGVAVRLLRAVHHSRPMPHRPNGAFGHLVGAPGVGVWVSGETNTHDEMTDIPGFAGRDGVDLAIVPIGGWGPRLSAGHMGPAEAATACAMTRAGSALPVHWGTLHPPGMHRLGGWMDRPLSEFRGALTAAAPGCGLLTATAGTKVAVLPGPAARRDPRSDSAHPKRVTDHPTSPSDPG